jgi:hypothetical protein
MDGAFLAGNRISSDLFRSIPTSGLLTVPLRGGRSFREMEFQHRCGEEDLLA